MLLVSIYHLPFRTNSSYLMGIFCSDMIEIELRTLERNSGARPPVIEHQQA